MSSTMSRSSRRQGLRALVAGILALAAYGAWAASSELALLSYTVVVLAAFIPAYLWLVRGAAGIPVLPAFALAHIPYFAFPMMRVGAATIMYDEDEILIAALSVAMFLVAASVPVFMAARAASRPRFEATDKAATGAHLHVLIICGMFCGAMFQAGLLTGWIWWLDTFIGAARSVALTFCLVACYCLGIAIAHRLISRRKIQIGIGLLAVNVILSWSSLFLIGGMMFILGAVLGYVIGSGKVPWKSFLVVFALVSVLQAGKRDMRDEYWYQDANYGDAAEISALPARMLEWGVRGLDVISRRDDPELQGDATRQSVLERASLLPILLLAQRMAPDVVDFLGGDTYFLLPQVLLPRFIVPDKPSSQEGMNMLNISFGVLLEHEAEHTAVGWGLISEAYANFGMLGILSMGLLVGFFCRIVTTRSTGQSPVSLPTLLAIAVLLNIVNMEADFTGLVLTLIQSGVAVLVFHGALTLIARRATQRARRSARLAMALRK